MSERTCKCCRLWDETRLSGEDRGLCLLSDEPAYATDSCHFHKWSCPECRSTRPPEFKDGLRCLHCGWREKS